MENEAGKVLILDDDVQVGQSIAQIATNAGFQARSSHSPDEFFEALQDWQPQFIVLDLIMPNMDGVEVVSELAERGCESSIIFSSGADQRVLDAAVRSAQGHGLTILGVLAKPFSRKDFIDLVSFSSKQLLPVSTPLDSLQPAPNPIAVTKEELADAIESGDIYITVQPKVYCSDCSLAGFEVLARWQNARLGAVSPDHFVSLAEESDLIDQLTWSVMKQSIVWLSGLPGCVLGYPELQDLATKLHNLTLSINISAKSLGHPTLFDQFADYCKAHGIAPERIYLELTETQAMVDPLSSLDTLTRLRVKGFNLSIDDFGTGYSSMKQLVRLPFSEIKVDKSFVMSALSSRESRSISESIIELGSSLHLTTTAEGIEDGDTLHFLKRINCDLAQGYYISPPLTLDAAREWILQHLLIDEEQRVDELMSLELLGSSKEQRFDRYTQLARQIFEVPYAAIALIGDESLEFKSQAGEPFSGMTRSDSFCFHAISQRNAFIVPDTLKSNLFRDNKYVVGEPHIRFYAGYPLRGPRGHLVGTLCLIDRKPRKLTDKKIRRLQALAGLVEKELLLSSTGEIDKQTGTLNHYKFITTSEHTVQLANQLGLPTFNLSVRLSNLGELNTLYGNDVGNQALLELANILKSLIRRSDVIGRVSGATFHILLLDYLDGHAARLVSKFKQRIKQFNGSSEVFQLRCHVQTLNRMVAEQTIAMPDNLNEDTFAEFVS